MLGERLDLGPIPQGTRRIAPLTGGMFSGPERGDDVDPSEYTFPAGTQIEAAAPELDWLNADMFIAVDDRQAGVKDMFIVVDDRQAGGVTQEDYLAS
jgi:hypothetical protein